MIIIIIIVEDFLPQFRVSEEFTLNKSTLLPRFLLIYKSFLSKLED
jgi:hypothetical protein